MKIDPNAPAFPAALSMNQHQRYSFLGSVGIPDSSGDYVTFDSLCRMKAAAEEIIAQHATLRASVAALEAERDRLWAWHDRVVRERIVFCALREPQPMTRGK